MSRVDDAPPALDGAGLDVDLGPVLGRGGFATTWAARRPGDGRRLAIKVSRAPSRAAEARLAAEAEAMARVGPPHLPELVGRGISADGRPWLAMERIEGELLSDLMARSEEPDPALLARVAGGLCAALGGLHRAGLVHGDLKPENAFVCADAVRLIDVGVGGGGTVEYAAPELLDGAEATAASDVYALGAVLYELLCGRPPFVGQGPEVELGHRALRPVEPGVLVPGLEGVDALLMACLAKDPARRPLDLNSIARILREALAETETETETETEIETETETETDTATATATATATDHGHGPRSPTTVTDHCHRSRSPITDHGPRSPASILPVVLLWTDAPDLDPVLRRRGLPVGSRQGGALCAFTPDSAEQPLREALKAAEDLAAAAARTALHVAPLAVRRRAAGPPLLAGDGLDLDTWQLPASWRGLHLTPAARRARPPDEHVAPLVGRGDLLSELTRELAPGREAPRLVTLIGEHGAGRSRLLRELAAHLRGGSAVRVLALRPGPDGDALRALAREEPVALLVDDADDLDDRSLDAIELATAAGGTEPLAVLVAATPRLEVLRPGWGARAASHRRIELGPLPEPDAMALAAHLLRPAEYPPEDSLRRIARMADGSPLALAQICRAVAEEGLIQPGPGGGHLLAADRLDELAGAPGVEWLARRELDRLTPALAELCRICAALLPGFAPDEVEAVSTALARARAAPVADPALGLAELRGRGILRAGPDGGLAFASAALASGMVRAAPPDEARRIHRAALDHALTGAALAAPAAPRALEARAHHAAAAGAPALAVDAHLALAAAAARRHDDLEAERRYTAALDLLAAPGPDPMDGAASGDQHAARAAALLGRGRVRYRIGRAADAVADLARAEELAAAAGDEVTAVRALLEQATALDWAADYDASGERAARALARAAPLADPTLEPATALAAGRLAWREERVADAVRLLTLAAASAAACGDRETRTVALVLLGPALVRAGDLAGAAAVFDEAMELCHLTGDRLHLCALHGNRMFLWSAQKRPDRARAELREAARLARQIGHPGPERVATYNLAEDLYWSGEDDREALALARRSRALQQRYIAEPVAEDALLVARVAAACGEAAEAAEALAWVEAHVPPARRSPAARLFARQVAAWIDPGPLAVWDALLDEAEASLAGDDRLEVLYWAARAARRAGADPAAADPAAADPAAADPAGLVARALTRAAALLPEFPIWRRRFDDLGTPAAEEPVR